MELSPNRQIHEGTRSKVFDRLREEDKALVGKPCMSIGCDSDYDPKDPFDIYQPCVEDLFLPELSKEEADALPEDLKTEFTRQYRVRSVYQALRALYARIHWDIDAFKEILNLPDELHEDVPCEFFRLEILDKTEKKINVKEVWDANKFKWFHEIVNYWLDTDCMKNQFFLATLTMQEAINAWSGGTDIPMQENGEPVYSLEGLEVVATGMEDDWWSVGWLKSRFEHKIPSAWKFQGNILGQIIQNKLLEFLPTFTDMKDRFQKSPPGSSRAKQWAELKEKVPQMQSIWVVQDKPSLQAVYSRMPTKLRCQYVTISLAQYHRAKINDSNRVKSGLPLTPTPNPNIKKDKKGEFKILDQPRGGGRGRGNRFDAKREFYSPGFQKSGQGAYGYDSRGEFRDYGNRGHGFGGGYNRGGGYGGGRRGRYDRYDRNDRYYEHYDDRYDDYDRRDRDNHDDRDYVYRRRSRSQHSRGSYRDSHSMDDQSDYGGSQGSYQSQGGQPRPPRNPPNPPNPNPNPNYQSPLNTAPANQPPGGQPPIPANVQNLMNTGGAPPPQISPDSQSYNQTNITLGNSQGPPLAGQGQNMGANRGGGGGGGKGGDQRRSDKNKGPGNRDPRMQTGRRDSCGNIISDMLQTNTEVAEEGEITEGVEGEVVTEVAVTEGEGEEVTSPHPTNDSPNPNPPKTPRKIGVVAPSPVGGARAGPIRPPNHEVHASSIFALSYHTSCRGSKWPRKRTIMHRGCRSLHFGV